MDAPGDVKAAVVTVAKVYLQPGDGDDGERVILRNTPITTNLLTLSNDFVSLAEDVDVPAGRYKQLRLVITGGYLEVEGANNSRTFYSTSSTYPGLPAGAVVTGDLQMPSYAQSGLKINLPGGGVDLDDTTTIVLVDFDVAQSFGKQAGQSGKWVMQPVVRALDFQATSTVMASAQLGTGVTLPIVNGAATTLAGVRFVLTPTAGDASPRTLTAESVTNGVARVTFRLVPPGTYTVRAELAGVQLTTSPAGPVTVTVGSAQTATAAFTITTAAAP
jgi:hypothetical protein